MSVSTGREPGGTPTQKNQATLLAEYKTDAVKQRARSAVRRAVARGDLTRPLSCPSCNLRKSVHAHHPRGYENPMDIEWMCQQCHSDVHFPRRVEGPPRSRRGPVPLDVILALMDAPGGDPKSRKRTMAWLRKNRPPITYEPAYRHLFDGPRS